MSQQILRNQEEGGKLTKMWSDLVMDSAIGKTAGTFNPIDTNQSSVKIQKSDATHIIGFLWGYCSTALTDAEIVPNAILRVKNTSLGIVDREYILPRGSNDSDAQTEYMPSSWGFIPFKVPKGLEHKLFGSAFEFSLSASVDNTGGLDVVIAVLFANGKPDEDFKLELIARKSGVIEDGRHARDAAKAAATANSDIALSNITLPSGVAGLIALLALCNPNGITAGDPISGYVEFYSSDVDISPCKIPFGVFWSPALGTVADSGNQHPVVDPFPWRMMFDKPTRGETTIKANARVLVAAGAAPDFTTWLGFDYSSE